MNFVLKINPYRRDFDETKYMCFLIKYAKYNEIWRKVNNSIKKEFDSEAAYNEKYLKIKIESCQGKIKKHFHSDKIQKQVSQCICLSVILIDSVYRTGKILLSSSLFRRM